MALKVRVIFCQIYIFSSMKVPAAHLVEWYLHKKPRFLFCGSSTCGATNFYHLTEMWKQEKLFDQTLRPYTAQSADPVNLSRKSQPHKYHSQSFFVMFDQILPYRGFVTWEEFYERNKRPFGCHGNLNALLLSFCFWVRFIISAACTGSQQ